VASFASTLNALVATLKTLKKLRKIGIDKRTRASGNAACGLYLRARSGCL
jgi:hypothetical protein